MNTDTPTDHYEKLLDRADHERTERKDREMEAAMQRDENVKTFFDEHARTKCSDCGEKNVWSPRYQMWLCSKTVAKYEAVYGEPFPL